MLSAYCGDKSKCILGITENVMILAIKVKSLQVVTACCVKQLELWCDGKLDTVKRIIVVPAG